MRVPRPAPVGQWKLGSRFAVAFALVAALVIALVGSLAYNTAASLIRTDARDEFDSTVESLSSDLSEPQAGRDSISPDSLQVLHSDTFAFQVLRPDGSVAVPVRQGDALEILPVRQEDRETAAEREPGVVATRNDSANEEDYRIAAVSLGGGNGAVLVGQRLSPTERILDSLALQTLVVGLAVLVGAALTGWLVGRGTTGRLVRLTETAEYVTSTGRVDQVTPELGEAGRNEVRRLGRAFNAMLARLASSREEQRRLVQNASHELRTPLTSLRTNASVLQRFDQLDPQARQRLIDDLQGEARELTDLVNELVELATENRRDEPEQDVELRELAQRVAQRVQRRTGREVTVDADGSVVRGRPSSLERALSNPVENAAKFDTEGSQPIEVAIAGGRVEVRDRGPGIAEEELGHVFERFYRSPAARGMSGSGLGLSMVADIAAEHGGTVFARNREGGGAVIGFHLPTLWE
ncbi:two-component system sensor histidine kinase MprB [Haloactinospora alba]|uniref:histidine kinase n=1 Tax=Haloactinospora alba TaxID=405555 RepID=A0A543NEA3_9ACTN|nr:ATP-binding protein [Haloactinospora alba]TQN30162.1 two-component system sensor histidine kinase MprB [Haloactinospora alba]